MYTMNLAFLLVDWQGFSNSYELQKRSTLKQQCEIGYTSVNLDYSLILYFMLLGCQTTSQPSRERQNIIHSHFHPKEIEFILNRL